MSASFNKSRARLAAFFGGRRGFVLLVAALQAAFWMLVILADPFGASTAADRVSESIFLKFYAFAYPRLPAPHVLGQRLVAPKARGRIVVVLYDETTGLPAPGSWPLPRSTHTLLLHRIMHMAPKAVFLDILFDTEKGGGNAQTVRMLDEIRAPQASPQASPPVFFAAYEAANRHGLVAPLQALPAIHAGETPLPGHVYRVPVEFEAQRNHYPLTDRHSQAGEFTAAAALYNVAAAADPDHLPALRPGPEDMLVAWGGTLPSKFRNAPAYATCLQVYETFEDRIYGIFHAFWLALFGDAPDQPFGWDRLQPCAYHTQVSAKDFFSTDPATQERLTRLIADSYVLIGAHVAGIGDDTVSPVHGKLPGVFLPAMALDNLLEFRGNPIVYSKLYLIFQAAVIFLALVTGRLFYEHRKAPTSRGRAALALAERFGVVLLIGALSGIALLGTLLWLQWPPYNWGAVFAVSTAEFLTGAGRLFLVMVAGEAGAKWGRDEQAD